MVVQPAETKQSHQAALSPSRHGNVRFSSKRDQRPAPVSTFQDVAPAITDDASQGIVQLLAGKEAPKPFVGDRGGGGEALDLESGFQQLFKPASVNPVAELARLRRRDMAMLGQHGPVLRGEKEHAAGFQEVCDPRDEGWLIGDMREHFQADDDVIRAGDERQRGEIAGDETDMRPTGLCPFQHAARQVRARDAPETGKLWAQPSRAAADFQNVEVVATQPAEPVQNDLGLASRDLADACLAVLGVPCVPERALVFDRFHARSMREPPAACQMPFRYAPDAIGGKPRFTDKTV